MGAFWWFIGSVAAFAAIYAVARAAEWVVTHGEAGPQCPDCGGRYLDPYGPDCGWLCRQCGIVFGGRSRKGGRP